MTDGNIDWRGKAVQSRLAAKRFFKLKAEAEQHLHPNMGIRDIAEMLYREWEATQPPVLPTLTAERSA